MRLLNVLFSPVKLLLRLSVDKKVSIITLILRELLSFETDDPAESLKLLLKLDRKIYSLTGLKSIQYGGGVHTKHKHTKYHTFFTENINDGARVL